MASVRERVRSRGTDWRVWLLTGFLVGWYAAEHVLHGVAPEILFVPILSVMYVYYVTIGLAFIVVGGQIGFWLGFVALCFLIAALAVQSWEWATTR